MIDENVNLSKPYGRGAYNKYDKEEQWIRISEGCPNQCPFCRESIDAQAEDEEEGDPDDEEFVEIGAFP